MSLTETDTRDRSAPKSKWATKIAQLDAWYDDWCRTEEAKILSVVGTGVLMFITTIVLFGYAAFITVALAAVPTMFFVLWMITVGK